MKKFTAFISLVLVLIMVASINPFVLSVNATSDTDPTTESEKASVVPQVYVDTKNGNGTTLQKADDYVDASIRIVDTDGTELTGEISFKVRGNSTAQANITKKAYTVKFDKKQEVLSMGKGKKWTLLANAFDPTLMRNYIAFDFAQTMGLEYTSQQRYVELWLDGSFRGCYVMMEPVEEGSDRVDIDIDSNDGMKDFLIELERVRVEADATYFETEGIRFATKEPEEPNAEQLSYIQSTMDDIMSVIKSGDKQQISSKIDIDSFARFYLLNEIYKTLDFDFSSVYFYYKDGVLYCGPVWDYDLSSGNINPKVSDLGKEVSKTDGLFAANCHFYEYLCSYDWFNREIRSTYLKYADYINNITAKGGLIDTLIETYGEVYERNFSDAGWKPTDWWVLEQQRPLATFEENVEVYREFIESRNAWLADYYRLDEGEFLLGDVDADGGITVLDATAILFDLAELKALTPDQESRADADKDGKVSVMDATAIQRFVANLTTEL